MTAGVLDPAPPKATAKIVRKARFSAAHYFWIESLTEAENWALFGKTSNRQAHGHNYELAVTVEGLVDPSTGMVMNLRDLKTILNEEVVEPLDFMNLNRQVPFFATHQPTLENMAVFLWRKLSARIDDGQMRLCQLRMFENEDMFVDYDGNGLAPSGTEATPMIEFTRQYDFCASHRLHNPAFDDAENARIFGKCNNPNGHGHNYTLWVTVAGEPNLQTGMVMNMVALDGLVESHLLSLVDHKDMNTDVPFMQGVIPTAENMVRVFWHQLAPHMPSPVYLRRLKLQETRNNFAEYAGDSPQ